MNEEIVAMVQTTQMPIHLVTRLWNNINPQVDSLPKDKPVFLLEFLYIHAFAVFAVLCLDPHRQDNSG